MRINAYNQISQIYQANKIKKTAKSGNTSSVVDQYQVSQSGKDYQVAKAAISQTSDVREDKVAQYKEALASGTYNVSSQEVAETIVSKYFDSVL